MKSSEDTEMFDKPLAVTCYHDLQLGQGGVRGVSQEDVDIPHHAQLFFFYTGVHPPLLVQDDEGAL